MVQVTIKPFYIHRIVYNDLTKQYKFYNLVIPNMGYQNINFKI